MVDFESHDDLYEEAIGTPGLNNDEQMDLYADLIDEKLGGKILYMADFRKPEPEDLTA